MHTYVATKCTVDSIYLNSLGPGCVHEGCNKLFKGSEPLKVYQPSESKLPFRSFINLVTFQLKKHFLTILVSCCVWLYC